MKITHKIHNTSQPLSHRLTSILSDFNIIDFTVMTENRQKRASGNRQFGKMAGLVQNSTVVLRLNFCAELNICASISATSPSC